MVSSLHDQAVKTTQLTTAPQEPVDEGEEVQPKFELSIDTYELMGEERGILHDLLKHRYSTRTSGA